MFLVILFMCHLAHAQIVDKIVALVDNKAITESDVASVLRQPGGKSPVADKRRQVINDLINEKILLLELERQKIIISDKEIDQALQDDLVSRQMSPEGLAHELARQGTTLTAYRELIADQLRRTQFLQKVIYPRIQISDYDLQQYYNKHEKEFSAFEKIRFLELLLTPDSIPVGQDLEQFARNVATRLRNGARFSELASRYSRGAFAAQGGDSGLVDTKSMRPDLLNILLSLKSNAISDPIPTPNGTFIFKVIENQGSVVRPYSEVKEGIRQIFFKERVQDELEKYVMQARSRHFVEIR